MKTVSPECQGTWSRKRNASSQKSGGIVLKGCKTRTSKSFIQSSRRGARAAINR